MKKKDKKNGTSQGNLKGAVKRVFSIRDKAFLLSASAVAAFFLCMVSFPQNPLFSRGRYQGFEVGVVAERDLFADRSITYADEEATKLKINAKVQLVPPVFIVQEEISERVKERFEIFAAIYSDGIIAKENPQRMYLGLQAALPGMFTREDVDTILASDNKLELVAISRDILETLLSRGVFNIPENVPGMNQGTIEIWYWMEGEKVRQKINIETIVSRQNLALAVSSALENKNIGPGELKALNIIVGALIEENTFYNADETEKYRERALEEVEPVMKTIVEGERIVKEGYVISPENMAEIAVLDRFSRRDNINAVLGTIVILLIVGALALFLLNPPVARAKLST